MLRKKSLTELRGIAQAFGVPDIFQKDIMQLAQAIEMKQQAMVPMPVVDIPKPAYDARLMTKPPAKRATREEIEPLLQPYLARGMRASFDEERWYFSCGKKTDEGTLRMPMRTILYCAGKVME